MTGPRLINTSISYGRCEWSQDILSFASFFLGVGSEILVKEHPLLVGKMTEANMRFTNMCSVSYAGMKGFSERTFGVTNSPKARNYYPSVRYLKDDALIETVCTGKIPTDA